MNECIHAYISSLEYNVEELPNVSVYVHVCVELNRNRWVFSVLTEPRPNISRELYSPKGFNAGSYKHDPPFDVIYENPCVIKQFVKWQLFLPL